MKPKMSCVNNCNSEVIRKTNPIQIVCLIPFESRVVRQEKISCTSGNIRSQIQTCITHLSTPVLIVRLKGHGDNTKGLWLDIVLYTLLSNCMRRDLKDTEWFSWWYSFHAGQQSSQWGFVGNDPVSVVLYPGSVSVRWDDEWWFCSRLKGTGPIRAQIQWAVLIRRAGSAISIHKLESSSLNHTHGSHWAHISS